MKTAKIFAAPATIAEVTTINARNIRIGLADFVKHTDETGVISDISDAFIYRLAYDSAVAKSGLREIFRRVKGWNENLQAIVINGTGTHDPNWNTIQQLTHDITRKYREPVLEECETTGDYEKFYDFCDALDAFHRPKPTAGALEALKKLAPHAYRNNQPMNRVFQKFCKAIGIFEEKAGSEYQKLYAQYSDELKGRKLDFKLFVSINPAHFLTMSNPIDDRRGKCLVSCHSLNCFHGCESRRRRNSQQSQNHAATFHVQTLQRGFAPKQIVQHARRHRRQKS